MLGFLAGVPGRLKTLTDRLSATWAAKLDTVAGLVTSTWAAKLDTLASNFTSTISGRIDAAITTRAADSSPLLTPPMAGGLFAPGQQTFSGDFATTYAHWLTHATGSVGTSFSDVVNITGSGVVEFGGVQVNAAGGTPTIYMDVIIDGATTLPYAVAASSTGLVGIIPIGAFALTTADPTPYSVPLLVFQSIPFKSSLQIRVKSSSATYTVKGFARLRRNS